MDFHSRSGKGRSVVSVIDLLSPRHLLAALRLIPLILVSVLLAPAWLAWIFLPPSRHDALIQVMQKLIEWTRAAK
ncbi:hypothetical protein ACFWWM_06055 [Streptomyces sp. NPDC058682]|uniref:hypothetical protein n=1 Tax=unclassified Streptomyces TaxID=2593676 RepID=UPI00224E7FE9|nr:hypothetical protein [Streptomyces sp. NBC_01214]MCX4804792.1 hypothetical protein [Streptomyces sp. NBC_01214]